MKVGGINGNRYGDLDFTVRPSLLRLLLIHVPNGTLVTLVFSAYTGDKKILFRGTIDLTKSGPAGVSLAAAPNPFKPDTNIEYAVRESGSVSIRIFSADGRLVRTRRSPRMRHWS